MPHEEGPRHRFPRWTAAALAAVWWLGAPLVEAFFYWEERRRGAYPPDADSIGIPIAQYAAGWLTLTPLVVAVVILALYRAPRHVRWLAFDRARPYRAALWSLALGAAAANELRTAAGGALDAHWLDLAHGLLGAVAMLALRAALCERRAAGRAAGPTPPAADGLAGWPGLREGRR